MNPSSVRLTTPARSATTPPDAANRYGTAMRSVCVRNASGFMGCGSGLVQGTATWLCRVTVPRAAVPPGSPVSRRSPGSQDSPHFRHGRRHRQNHNALQHLHHLLRDQGVDRESALREGGEEERGEQDAGRVVAADECDRDPEEAGAAGEALLVVVLVAEHVVEAPQAGDRAAEREDA